jgi:tetratricopeptide (TPR) repeat protein
MPQTMRLSFDDKADYAYYRSKLNRKMIAAIEDSANEAALRINSNADLNTARELIGIENAAHEIAESQIQAACIIVSSIQASTDRIIDYQNKNTDRIVDSIEDLRALFDARFAEIIWLLEQNHKELITLLEKIHNAMITPKETEAREKTKWAIKDYNEGRFDKAIEHFNISYKLYPQDFIVYLFLGNIYLFEKKNPEKALENYKLALDYIADSSSYYTSLALLHIGFSHYGMGNFQDAYIAASNAIQKNPKLSEANYLCAQNCSKLGRYDEATNYLRKAIDADRGYSLRALADEDFVPMSSKFKDLMEELTRSEKAKAKEEIIKTNQLLNTFNDVGAPNEVKEKLKEGINLINTETYMNFRDAKYKAKASQKGLLDSLIARLSGEISEVEPSIMQQNIKFDQLTQQYNENQRKLATFGSVCLICLMIYNGTDFLPLGLFGMICIPFVLYYLVMHISLIHDKNPYKNQLKSLKKIIFAKREILAAVESNKSKLNIDKVAESFNFIDYEKYLRKTYG